ncbi:MULTISPECIES: FliM/FliN family flagellar motor switch protein [Sulfitobacter]|jgi:flagellar motor switch protein FliN|nr:MULTISPECIES: FliM/FliN family flagellar motor switch protein [Sulfitobacter]MCD2362918.1 FliM/FliN family flagellar motor switch protein [Sulfitobacter mediterraneus]
MVDEKQEAAEMNTPQSAQIDPDELAPEAPAEKPPTAKKGEGKSLDAIFGVKLDVRVVLGRSRMPISELLDLTKGSVIELDRRIGEPVDIMINDRMVARGDLVRVQGDMLGVALREIVKDFITDA